MASTIQIIDSSLIALGFNNPSGAAIENKIAQAVGIPIDNTVQEFTNSENRILNIIVTQRYGKDGYYVAKALAFQLGDDLIIDPITLDDVYAVINPLNQIISQAAFEDFADQLFLKVAKINTTTGDLEALNWFLSTMCAKPEYFLFISRWMTMASHAFVVPHALCRERL